MPWWSWSLKYQSLFFLMWRLIFFKKNELVPLDEYFKIVLNFVVQHFIMYHSSTTTTDMTIILNIKLVQFFREINFTKISLKKKWFHDYFRENDFTVLYPPFPPTHTLNYDFFSFSNRISNWLQNGFESNSNSNRIEILFFVNATQCK